MRKLWFWYLRLSLAFVAVLLCDVNGLDAQGRPDSVSVVAAALSRIRLQLEADRVGNTGPVLVDVRGKSFLGSLGKAFLGIQDAAREAGIPTINLGSAMRCENRPSSLSPCLIEDTATKTVLTAYEQRFRGNEAELSIEVLWQFTYEGQIRSSWRLYTVRLVRGNGRWDVVDVILRKET